MNRIKIINSIDWFEYIISRKYIVSFIERHPLLKWEQQKEDYISPLDEMLMKMFNLSPYQIGL